MISYYIIYIYIYIYIYVIPCQSLLRASLLIPVASISIHSFLGAFLPYPYPLTTRNHHPLPQLNLPNWLGTGLQIGILPGIRNFIGVCSQSGRMLAEFRVGAPGLESFKRLRRKAHLRHKTCKWSQGVARIGSDNTHTHIVPKQIAYSGLVELRFYPVGLIVRAALLSDFCCFAYCLSGPILHCVKYVCVCQMF